MILKSSFPFNPVNESSFESCRVAFRAALSCWKGTRSGSTNVMAKSAATVDGFGTGVHMPGDPGIGVGLSHIVGGMAETHLRGETAPQGGVQDLGIADESALKGIHRGAMAVAAVELIILRCRTVLVRIDIEGMRRGGTPGVALG